MTQPTRPSAASRIYRVVGWLVLLGIVAFLIARIYTGRAALFALDPRWDARTLLFSAVTAIVAYQALFVAWLMMLRRTGYFRRGHTVRYARIWWVSYMYRYVPGKVLLVVERARLGVPVGIPPAAGAAMPVIETLLAVLAGSAVSLLAVSYYTRDDGGTLFAIGVIAVAIVLLLPVAYRWLCGLSIIRRRYPELASVALGSGDLLVLVVPYLVHYGLLGSAFFMLAQTVHPLELEQLPGMCGIFALSHVIGLLALFAPGGLGVREGALAVQLERIIPAGIADALAVVARAWFTAIELVCYLSVLLLGAARTPADDESGNVS